MKMRRWIALMAAANLLAGSFASAVRAADIEIIGTDESEVQTEAAAAETAPRTDGSGADAASSDGAGAGITRLDGAGAGTASSDGAAQDRESQAGALEGGSGIQNPAEAGITAEDAVSGARTLYSQMQHYADLNDNSSFASLFEAGADAQTVQDQLQVVKSSLNETKDLSRHVDLCFLDPTKDTTKSPYYFAVALCDYEVDDTGAVAWYSTLMRLASYEDGWKASISPAEDLLDPNYPEGFMEARSNGRNAVDLYPSFGMRFASGAVFEGALYALPNLLWQKEDGAVECAVWLANGTQTTKWCDTIDLIVTDSRAGDVVKVNVPVQTALQGGESAMVNCSIPAEYVDSGTREWEEIHVNSNLRYQ